MEIENLQHFSDTLTVVPIRRVARGARFQWSVQPCPMDHRVTTSPRLRVREGDLRVQPL